MATPVNTPDKVTYFAETDYRSKRIKFGIRDQDRERHVYVIGKTGMGKSTMLENLAIQDIANGEGLCFIDPHGGTAETLLSYIPEHRIKDVIYFAPFDQEFPVALNVMEDIGRDKRPLVASGLIGAFKKVWVDAWSARMEYILSNALLALLEYPGATLLGVNRMFADKNYRTQIVNNVTDPSVKAFWVDEYAKYSDKFATEATAAIQNKVGQFAANPIIRNMIGQPKSTFDIRKVMDDRKILIVNLSKGRMGEGNANLVGSMLITKIYLAAMSRADVGAEVVRGLPPFYLYVDEFQSFANESFADILSEARKYKLSLTVAHQYIEQMSEEVRAAVFGNVGTMCSFRVGAYDAEVLEKEFAPAFTAEDMVNLGFAQIYLKLMINGVGSPPFSATTLNRPPFPPRVYTNEVIAASRAQFGRARAVVEEEIQKWHEPIPEPPRDPNALPIPETRKYAPGTRPLRPTPIGASASYTGVLPRSPANGQKLPSSPAQILPQQNFGLPAQAGGQVYPAAPRSVPSGETATGVVPPRADTAGAPTPPAIPASPHRELSEYQSHTPEVAPVYLPAVPPLPRPPMIRAGGGQPTAQKRESGEVHQPFRDELRNIRGPEKPEMKESKPHAFGQKPSPISTRQPPTPSRTPTSLSSLKSEQKKDKGPSTQNLSSLKTLIDAAFAVRPNEEKKEKVSLPPTRLRLSTPPQQAGPTSTTAKVLADKSDGQEENFSTAPIVTSAVPPPSLLGDPTLAQNTKEVPEDVLRGLLAD